MRFDIPTRQTAQNAPKAATVAVLEGLPGGKAGTVQTLKRMRDLARQAVRAPSQRIRETALSIVAPLPARRWADEVRAVHEFVRDRIRYVRDPVNLELVASPEKVLEYGQGDCDDKSALLAAMLESLGHPSRFVAVGINGGPFSHVYVETKIGAHWIPLETIIPKPMGWKPPDETSRYILKV